MDFKEKVKLFNKINNSNKASLIWNMIRKLKCLRVEHKFNDEQIADVINKMDLPLGLCLFIKGNFSNLIELV